MYQVAIIGGGILGTTLAYRLSKSIPGERIVVIEKENEVARHTSSRNTGVLHRPFYLDPVKKEKFARCAQDSYGFWKEYARTKGLPWKEVGTLEVAVDDAGVKRLRKYKEWSLQNGMADSEVRLLSAEEAREIEPNVRCAGALLCTTDTAVDFGVFTQALKQDAQANGVEFLMGCEVKKIMERDDEIEVAFDTPHLSSRTSSPAGRGIANCPSTLKGGEGVSKKFPLPAGEGRVRAKFLVNCAGGGALRIAHMMGLAREYADLNFRGEYLIVEGTSARLASRNIYSVPRHSEFPFLDPHFVVRHDGQVEIGPSAVPVFGPYTYRGLGSVLGKLTERPVTNKLKLCANPEFLRLCAQEWRSSFSAKSMVNRVRKFLPDLKSEDCPRRGTSGVRASLIDCQGKFVPEVVEMQSAHSLHILNFNSPGATGAPAYADYIRKMIYL